LSGLSVPALAGIGGAILVGVIVVVVLLIRRSRAKSNLRPSTGTADATESSVEPDSGLVAAAERLHKEAQEMVRLGRYDEAETMHARVVEMLENALGAKHPDVATALSNLAGVYFRQKRFEECEKLHKRALEIRESTLGEQNPQVATSLNNLALLYKTWGKLTEVEPLYERSLRILQGTLGPEHPNALSVADNLNVFQREQAARRARHPKPKRKDRLFG
jgi:tetratricopeptide (TPR) repeat protein